MNRFDNLFPRRDRKAFVPFFTLGDPEWETSLEIIASAVHAGADALELGYPFADPISDGPTNQKSMQRALRAGATFDSCTRLVATIRQRFPDLPISLLLYYNLLYFQKDDGYRKLADAGVDAVVISDLPFEESGCHVDCLRRHDIGCVHMVAPNTPVDRARVLFEESRGFTYVISRFGTTGADQQLSAATVQRVRLLRSITDKPYAFGISHPNHVRQVWDAGADGVIVGSHFISMIERNAGAIAPAINGICSFIMDVKSPALAAPNPSASGPFERPSASNP
jgi:tryptophan synthase alpha chain